MTTITTEQLREADINPRWFESLVTRDAIENAWIDAEEAYRENRRVQENGILLAALEARYEELFPGEEIV